MTVHISAEERRILSQRQRTVDYSQDKSRSQSDIVLFVIRVPLPWDGVIRARCLYTQQELVRMGRDRKEPLCGDEVNAKWCHGHGSQGPGSSENSCTVQHVHCWAHIEKDWVSTCTNVCTAMFIAAAAFTINKCNSPQIFTKGYTDRHHVVYTENGVLCSLERKWSFGTYYSMINSWNLIG